MSVVTVSAYDMRCIVTFVWAFAGFNWAGRFLSDLFRLHSFEVFASAAKPFYGREVIFIKSVFWDSMDRMILMFTACWLFLSVVLLNGRHGVPSISYIFVAFVYGIFNYISGLSSYRECEYREDQKKKNHDDKGVCKFVGGDASGQKLDHEFEEKYHHHHEDQNIKENPNQKMMGIAVTDVQEYRNDHDISN